MPEMALGTDMAQTGRRAASGSRGFTLVEVLLALVVLMVGIYAMLRIFPSGYSTMEMTQQRTVAAQLAEAELSRWRLSPDALPDAIVATDYTGALISPTLTNRPENVRQLLIYGEVAARVPGTETYEYWPVPPYSSEEIEKFTNLDRIARPLIYSPNDLTPSQCDAVLGFEGQPNHVVVHPNWQPNSLYLPRTVLGERIDIRRLGTTGRGVPFYLLSHAPLDILRYQGEDLPHTPGDDRTKVYADVYDARPWRYLPSPLDRPLGEQEFTYDNTGRTLTFGPAAAPPYERKFKVDYTDPVSLSRVFGFTVTAPAGSSAGNEQLPEGTDPYSIQVHELMVPLDQADYEYYTEAGGNHQLEWPRNAYYVNSETLVTGKLEFSPALQVLPMPGDISIAKVDYRVRDWQILVFDVEVPPDGVVNLPIRGLKGSDYVNPPRQDLPQEIARAIRWRWDPVSQTLNRISDPADRDGWAYVVAVDRQSGDVLTDERQPLGGLSAYPQERLSRFRVDYREGRLSFNYGQWEVPAGTFSVPLEGNGMRGSQYLHTRAGRTYRIFCRAESDWAVQLTMAPRLYARAGAATAEGTMVPYFWGPAQAGGQFNAKQIYFPLSEAGQAVAVDYYTKEGRFVSGEVHSVSGPDIKDRGEWVCRLSSELREEPNEWGPVTVRGVSVRARVTWVTRGGAATLQDWVVATKRGQRVRRSLEEGWHQITVTTYLTRVPL